MQSLCDDLCAAIETFDQSVHHSPTERVLMHAKIKAVLAALDTPASADFAAPVPAHKRDEYMKTLRLMLERAEGLFRPAGGVN